MKERNSNFELLRIISTFLIVLYHTIYHGQVLDNTSISSVKLILEFIELLTLVHVNSFVLVTGYYQSKSKLKISKIIELIILSLFYQILFILLFSLVNDQSFTITAIYFQLNIFDDNGMFYWFIKLYIILYLLSPYLNIIIEKLEKDNYKKFLTILIILFCFICWMSNARFMLNSGYTLLHFIILYFIGAYLNKYPIKFKISKNKLRIILVSLIMILTISNFALYKISLKIGDINTLANLFKQAFIDQRISYNNLFVLFSSIAYFLIFTTFEFKNKFINLLAKASLGIYLLHDNINVRNYIYNKIFKLNTYLVNDYKYILYILLVALVIFTVSLIIELIRIGITSIIKKNKHIINIKQKIDKKFVLD